MNDIINNIALKIEQLSCWRFKAESWEPLFIWGESRDFIEISHLSSDSTKFFYKKQLGHLFYVLRFDLAEGSLNVTGISFDNITNEIFNIERTGMIGTLLGRASTVEFDINFLETVIEKYDTL